ncbi:MAG: SGNH/GDSL hydrolase family protein [Bradyrhizobium sp.]
MRFGLALGLASLMAIAAAALTPAEAAQRVCSVAPDLLAAQGKLPRVANAVSGDRPLNILVIGSGSSTIQGAAAQAYPARLQVALSKKLPAAKVDVSVELFPERSAEEASAGFAGIMSRMKPALVVWQTGTVDALRSIEPDAFRASVDHGVTVLKDAGADVILMNLQYSPRTETMISAGPYLDNLRAVADERDVPLFNRFAIMRQWNEQGEFDLFSAARGLALAERVHDCLGRALADFILRAASLDSAREN